MKGQMTFYFGVMGSAKTALALIKRFSYVEEGKKVEFLKSEKDNRDGTNVIRSRTGMSAPVKVIRENQCISEVIGNPRGLDIIIVDEAQFLTRAQVEELKAISSINQVPVDAYGLKNDFRGEFFEGSEALFKLSEKLVQLEKNCSCGNIAIKNVRYNPVTGEILREGPQIVIGGNEAYMSICYECDQTGYVKLNSNRKKVKKFKTKSEEK